jgi:hypothetical protein
MVGKPAEEVRAYLNRRGWHYVWMRDGEQARHATK